jgi:hypothetical protein
MWWIDLSSQRTGWDYANGVVLIIIAAHRTRGNAASLIEFNVRSEIGGKVDGIAASFPFFNGKLIARCVNLTYAADGPRLVSGDRL